MAAVAALALMMVATVGCDGDSTPDEEPPDFQPTAIEPDEQPLDKLVEADQDTDQDDRDEADDRDGDEQFDETIAYVEGDLDYAIDRARDAADRSVQPGQSRNKKKSNDIKREQWKPAVLQVVTNFEKADVTVNGLDYPEYVENDEEAGMVLPAGGPHTVEVTFDGKVKTYRIHLRAHETRLLIVELSGFQGGNARAESRPKPSPRPSPRRREPPKEEKEEDTQGRVTVYSKPKGTVIVDGGGTGENTPGTVDVKPGRHEIQVKFESGEESEKKIVRVRKGSRIKLFFREKK
ncbi:MAG: PEGA domain-containing protein [Persicimonas sp.]